MLSINASFSLLDPTLRVDSSSGEVETIFAGVLRTAAFIRPLVLHSYSPPKRLIWKIQARMVHSTYILYQLPWIPANRTLSR